MILHYPSLCDFCGCCVAVCPKDAIELFEAELLIDKNKCNECLLCVYVCPLDALNNIEENFLVNTESPL